MNFQDLGLCESVLRAVLMEGYDQATPIQLQAIGPVLEGRDVIGCAQTGTGKTAAFALPLLHRLVSAGNPPRGTGRKIRVLVLASTRELASQIRDSFATYGHYTPLRMAAVYGGVSQAPQERLLKHGIDVLIATPGRLLDLVQQGFVDLGHVESLVLDEADRMLDMGFLPAIREVLRFVPKVRQTLLFSATMPEPILELAATILSKPVSITIEPKQKATELVEQSVFFLPQKQKNSLLIHLIQRWKPGRAIVFTRTKHGADRVVRHLVEAGIKAEAIHSNKSQNKRQKTLDSFKWTNPPILVATDIAARGIDVDEVTHVFNFDMPQEAETYVHRIGRSGRAGASGIAVSFCDVEEKKMLKAIEKLINRRIAPNPEVIGDLPKRCEGKRSDDERRSDSSDREPRDRNSQDRDPRSRHSSDRRNAPKRSPANGERDRRPQQSTDSKLQSGTSPKSRSDSQSSYVPKSGAPKANHTPRTAERSSDSRSAHAPKVARGGSGRSEHSASKASHSKSRPASSTRSNSNHAPKKSGFKSSTKKGRSSRPR